MKKDNKQIGVKMVKLERIIDNSIGYYIGLIKIIAIGICLYIVYSLLSFINESMIDNFIMQYTAPLVVIWDMVFITLLYGVVFSLILLFVVDRSEGYVFCYCAGSIILFGVMVLVLYPALPHDFRVATYHWEMLVNLATLIGWILITPLLLSYHKLKLDG